ncbi:hypothetical protein [Pajaroellobacter abortibovis]|uniref:Uncharacterized protein n=1 Tax=Pajaroellobacter abortibovis TaxID=1882918 RepID=A0A1L6MY92_9BACT|nr:hypothetical protein [Pajaroellobacter abortibovis]APS00378.1 hypothetical protein BCY86_06560 [Pajaroellobacter abortibovis]
MSKFHLVRKMLPLHSTVLIIKHIKLHVMSQQSIHLYSIQIKKAQIRSKKKQKESKANYRLTPAPPNLNEEELQKREAKSLTALCSDKNCPPGLFVFPKYSTSACTSIIFITSVKIRRDMQETNCDSLPFHPTGKGFEEEEFFNKLAITWKATKDLNSYFTSWLSTLGKEMRKILGTIKEYPVHDLEYEEFVPKLKYFFNVTESTMLQKTIHVTEDGRSFMEEHGFIVVTPARNNEEDEYIWTGTSHQSQLASHCDSWVGVIALNQGTGGNHTKQNYQ